MTNRIGSYEIEKQVVEQIGDYFWRREGYPILGVFAVVPIGRATGLID